MIMLSDDDFNLLKLRRLQPINKNTHLTKFTRLGAVLLIITALSFGSSTVWAAPGGYGQFFVPGDEDLLSRVLQDLDALGGGDGPETHSIIEITSWGGNTTIYYDHWEDGYEFDPDNPVNYDEIYTLANRGSSQHLESNSIPLNRTVDPGTPCVQGAPGAGERNCEYDGRDIIYVAGSSVTVTRAGWIDDVTTYQALAWEVYPVRPQLIKYILPFGEDLATPAGGNLLDFSRVYAFIQATQDNTVIQIDFDGDGTFDSFDHDYDGTVDGTQFTLNTGDVYLLDRTSDGAGNPYGNLSTGTVIIGSDTIQMQYIIGQEDQRYEVRGLSAYPRGFWDDEYYAVLDDPSSGTETTDIYLYNPHDYPITIDWETRFGSGSFSIPPKSTVSYNAAASSPVPEDSAIYLKGSDVFWGNSSNDAEGPVNDWAYSLVPAFLLDQEHYLGWAPSYDLDQTPTEPNPERFSGIFVTAAQDNIRLFVDEDNDGTADFTYDLNAFESQYIYDPDEDLSNARIYATGPYSMAYGQNADNVGGGLYALDLGYTVLPTSDRWFELVLDVEKSADPALVAANTSGEQTTFTLEISTHEFDVQGLIVVDTLPTGWQYVDDSTVITLPDGSTISGNAADPDISGATLTWQDSVVVGWIADLDPNQKVIIAFDAETTVATFDTGDLSINDVEARATRTVETVTQTFTATDFEFVSYGELEITKTSDVDTAAYPGDTITYTVVVTNPSATETLNNIAVYDPMPEGVTFNSGTVTLPIPGTSTFRDIFTTQAYNNSHGTATWSTSWSETGDDGDAGSGTIFVNTGNSRLRFHNIGNGQTDYIERTVDLSGLTNRSLSFNYSEDGTLETNEDTMTVDIIIGTTTTTIVTTNDDFSATTYNGSLEALITSGGSETVTIRFSASGFTGGAEYWNLNDITFQGDSSTSIAALDDPPNLIDTSDGYDIGPGESMTLSFTVTVDDPLDTAITELTNTASATSDEIKTPIEASVTDPVINPNHESSEVGDLVWLDADGDGVYDVGESGIANVEVTLKDEFGTPLQVATTDSQGRYLFTGVPTGNGYYVEITGGLPAGLTRTPDTGRSDDRTDAFDLIIDLGTNRDEFPNPPRVYNNSDGSIDWSADSWTETNDSNASTGGDIRITGGQELRVSNRNGGPLPSIDRQLSIPEGAISATLSFDWRTLNVDSDDEIVFEISRDGTNFVTFRTFAGYTGANNGAENFDISDYLSEDTTIRFRVTNNYERVSGTNHYFFVDDLNINYGGYVPEYLDADLGYRPDDGTATIGDLVWSDADGDGVRDVGEPGMGGVEVELWNDTDGDGVGDTLRGTATTAADGSYFFAGVPASGSEDYVVHIDANQAALADYTNTTDLTHSFLDVADGGSYLTADFGFQQSSSGTTFTIQDRVWLDTDEDEDDDGESGMAGVTVVLLDNSGNQTATTTTDSDGNFEFTGVPGDVRYSWEVTDRNGMLNNYYGTTDEARAGIFQMPGTLTQDEDYTAEPTEPHFGYNQSRSIGDTVFNDLGGTNGVQDSGEPGIAGVSVYLYRDVDDDGEFEPGGDDGNSVAHLVTDANGNYLFTGLDDGDYWVSIDNTQAALSGYDILTTADNDTTGASGHQRLVDLTGGTSNLDIDYGYRSSVSYDVSGSVWDNPDDNATIDTGEDGFSNVTVELWRDDGDDSFDTGTDTRVATATTDAFGNYSFTGLPEDDYYVRITDANGILTDYEPNYEDTEGAGQSADSYNNWERIVLAGSNQTGINFGFNEPDAHTTMVVLSAFRAYTENGQVVVEWETSSEVGTVGFYLKRQNRKGRFKKVNKELLPALVDSPMGGTYRYIDEGAQPDGRYTYKLIEIETSGKKRKYGPFTVTVDQDNLNFNLKAVNSRPMTKKYERKKRRITKAQIKRFERGKKARKKAFLKKKKRKGIKAKINIMQTGLYYLDASRIAGVMDITVEKAERWINKHKIAIKHQGQKTAWMAAADNVGLYFYAEGIDSLYTDQNVYWLGKGNGLKMKIAKRRAPSEPAIGDEYFERRSTAEEDKHAATVLFTQDEVDYWMWDYVFAGYAGTDTKAFRIQAPGAVSIPGAEQAAMIVHLVGAVITDAEPDHHVQVRLNQVDIGEAYFSDTDAKTFMFNFDAGLLQDGENYIEVVGKLDTGVPYSFFYIDGFELRYPSYYQAENDQLFFSNGANRTATITGFTSPQVLVMDITDPHRPKLMKSLITEYAPGDYDVTVRFSKKKDRLFLAVNRETAIEVTELEADIVSNLRAKRNRADYIIVTTSEMKAAAQTLADHRQAQGLESMVVDIDDIMDEFNFGVYSPLAIHDFLVHAYDRWKKRPSFVLLAGSATHDYKDYKGYGDNLVPTLMVGTPYGQYPSDNRLADIIGDEAPEIAIGRIPALTAEELQVFVDKIIAYEQTPSAQWAGRVLFIADTPDPAAGDFVSDSNVLASLLTEPFQADTAYLSVLGLNDTRQKILGSIESGLGYMNYLGHSSADRLSGKGLFKVADVSGLNNGPRLPVMTFMSCMAGRFDYPGWNSLAEALVVKEAAGAAGVWASSGLALNEESVLLAAEFYNLIFQKQEKTLGAATSEALKRYAQQGRETYMADIYNLLGDPALQLK